MKGKGTIGSEILVKINEKYKDLSLIWLITGNGRMLTNGEYPTGLPSANWSEEESGYAGYEQSNKSLRQKITILENALADKEKIIRLLEAKEQR